MGNLLIIDEDDVAKGRISQLPCILDLAEVFVSFNEGKKQGCFTFLSLRGNSFNPRTLSLTVFLNLR